MRCIASEDSACAGAGSCWRSGCSCSPRSRWARTRSDRRQRQPHAARHGQPGGHRPARASGSRRRRTAINPVVLRAPGGAKITASKYKTPIDDTVKALKADPDVRSATSPLSSDGKALLVEGQGDRLHRAQPEAEPERATTDDANRHRRARRPGARRRPRGRLRRLPRPEGLQARDDSSEVVGLGMAVIVLLFTFGTVVAMGLPIVTALFGLVMRALDHHPAQPRRRGADGRADAGDDDRARRRDRLRAVHRHPPPRATARRHGHAESIARATATSGGAVVFAGSTVIVALLSLAVVGIPLVTTLGYTSALVVAVAVLGGDHAAAGAARRSSATGSTGCGSRCRTRRRRRPPARLAALGAVRRAPPGAARARRDRRAGRARAPRARSLPRPAGQRRAAREHRRAAAPTTG